MTTACAWWLIMPVMKCRSAAVGGCTRGAAEAEPGSVAAALAPPESRAGDWPAMVLADRRLASMASCNNPFIARSRARGPLTMGRDDSTSTSPGASGSECLPDPASGERQPSSAHRSTLCASSTLCAR